MPQKEYTSKLIMLSVVMLIFIAPIQTKDILVYAYPTYLKIGIGSTFMLIAIFFWIYAGYKNNNLKIVSSKFYLPIVLFLIWTAVSFIWSHNLHDAVIRWIQYLSYAILFFIIINLFRNKELVNAIFKVLIISLLLLSIIGLAQYYLADFFAWIGQFFHQSAPPAATFQNRNFAMHVVVMLIPIVFLSFLKCANTKFTLFYWLTAFLALWFVIVTGARQAYLAVFAQLLVLLLFIILSYLKSDNLFLKGIPYPRYKFFALIFMLLALFIGANTTNQGFSLESGHKTERLSELSFEEAPTNTRIPGWINTLEMIKDRPLTGFGINQWRENYPLYYDRVSDDLIFGDKLRLRNLHNDYLEIFSNVGLIGYLPLLFILYLIINKIWVSLTNKDFYAQPEVLSLALGMIGFAVVAMFSFPIWGYVAAFILFIYIALLEFLTTSNSQFVFVKKNFWPPFLMTFLAIIIVINLFYALKWNIAAHYHGMSVNQFNKNNFAKAVEYSEKSSYYNPYSEKYLNQTAFLLMRNNRHKEAIPYLLTANEITLFNNTSLNNLHSSYSEVGDLSNSEIIARKIIVQEPFNIRALLRLVKITYDQEKYEETTSLYRQLKRSFEKFKDRDNFESYHSSIAYLALELNNPKYFDYIYDDLINRRPTANNYAVYAFIKYKLGEKARAKELFLKAIDKDKNVKILDKIKEELQL